MRALLPERHTVHRALRAATGLLMERMTGLDAASGTMLANLVMDDVRARVSALGLQARH